MLGIPHRRGLRPLLLAFALAVTGSGAAVAQPDPAPAAEAAALPTSWATVVNQGSGKCVDARAAGTVDGTVVQQYACNGSQAQQWQFQDTGSGQVRVGNRNDAAKVWDVTGVSAADGAPVQLWAFGGGGNQQWQAVAEPGGAFHFVNRHSGKCLDVPSASADDSVQLQQYTCNGTAAQSFFVNPVDVQQPPGTPDLGPNVTVFDPSTPAATIQGALNAAFAQQETNQFGSARKAFLFKPGTYDVDANVGYYTQVAGLGLSPDDVTIRARCTPRPTGSRATPRRTSGVRRRTCRSPRRPAPTAGRCRRRLRTGACICEATSSWTTAAGPAAATWPTRSSTARSGRVRSSSG
ncbi:hypothetical protein SPURM210S_05737 [Streptomyces purpurascens]